MGRRKKGDPINGWVVIDKPKGVTSTDVVGKVRRAFNARKAGHGGTLDPLATGMLPIALGEATKTVPYTVDAMKAYEFIVRFGEERSTDDLEGEVLARSDLRPSDEDILAAVPDFLGEVQQVPPRFSAIKVDGERAYDLAREGETVELQARPVYIERIDLRERIDDAHIRMAMSCGKGTYVRALARDLGRKLGGFATIADIRRTKVGPFDASLAISLDSLAELNDSPPPKTGAACLHPVETALDGIPALAVTETDAHRIKQGGAVRMTRLMAADLPPDRSADERVVRVHSASGTLIALAEIDQGAVKPMRVFSL